jgi:hypothetical protein
MRLFKRRAKFVSIADVDSLPRGMRGVYVLYKRRPRVRRLDAVYVGMAAEGGMRLRLRSDRAKKQGLALFGVNITPAEVRELEGSFRHIYRRDSRAARLNVQRSFGRMKKLPLILDGKRATTDEEAAKQRNAAREAARRRRPRHSTGPGASGVFVHHGDMDTLSLPILRRLTYAQ